MKHTRHDFQPSMARHQEERYSEGLPAHRAEVDLVAFNVASLSSHVCLCRTPLDRSSSRLLPDDPLLLFLFFLRLGRGFWLILLEGTPFGWGEGIVRDLVTDDASVLKHGDIVGRGQEVG